MVGILFACIAFKGRHLCKATKALEEIGSIERANTLDLFRVLLTKSHTEEISKWLFESWNLVQPWHFEVADYLKKQYIKSSYQILKLALVIQPDNIVVFCNYAAEFTKMVSSNVILEYIGGEKAPEKLTLNEFMSLTTVLMQDRNALVLK